MYENERPESRENKRRLENYDLAFWGHSEKLHPEKNNYRVEYLLFDFTTLHFN